MKRLTQAAVLLFCLLFNPLTPHIYSQISEGGIPPSFTQLQPKASRISSQSVSISFDPFQLLDEDQNKVEIGMPLRCAELIPVDFNMKREGVWTILPDGTQICRMEIFASGALAIMLTYDKFVIPEGGKLFIYNPQKTKVLGAYTEKTNPLRKEFATEFVYGDRIILEYVAPEKGYMPEAPEILINAVHYGYNHILVPLEDGSGFTNSILRMRVGESQSCMININCPEGDNWQHQKRGVVKTITGGYLCTGTLVNNTSYDFDPLLLTANHCFDYTSEKDINQMILYFHYESPDCSTSVPVNAPTMSGAQSLVRIPWKDGSDGALLRLKERVPEDYNVFFNGWDRRNSPSPKGVGIHHPMGDVKKISTYLNPAVSAKIENGSQDAHWRVVWSPTVSGHSSTQQGSSGSPLFNDNGLVIGTLSGGDAGCYYPNGFDGYGKLWYHWDRASQKMNEYLDPQNTGKEFIKGLYIGQEPSEAYFQYEPEIIVTDEPVTFTNASQGAQTWKWTFEGGGIENYDGENPPGITFQNEGKYTISLTINKGTNLEDTYSKVIHVAKNIAPVADFLINGQTDEEVEVSFYHSVEFTNKSTGPRISCTWSFENGDPLTSSEENPVVAFHQEGIYSVSLSISNGLGTDVKTKKIIVAKQKPLNSFSSESSGFVKYPDHGIFLPSGGGEVQYNDETRNLPTSRLWTFEGGQPETSGIVNPLVFYTQKEGTYDVTLSTENEIDQTVLVKEDYIQIGGTAKIWNITEGKKGDSVLKIDENNYLTGTNNQYVNIAEYFDNEYKGEISKVDVWVKATEGDVSTRKYTIAVYSELDGKPDKILTSKQFSGADINPSGYTTIEFSRAAEVNGNFFIIIGGLNNNTNKIAIGASQVENGSVWIFKNNQWSELKNYFLPENVWNISLNVVPEFTYSNDDFITDLDIEFIHEPDRDNDPIDITFRTNAQEWNISSEQSWIELTKNDENSFPSVTVKLEENNAFALREGNIKITAGTAENNIPVKQAGTHPKNLDATFNDTQQRIEIKWEAIDDVSYTLYKDGELLISGITYNRYNDNDFEKDKEICYSISAVYNGIQSSFSDTECITIKMNSLPVINSSPISVYTLADQERYIIESTAEIELIRIHDLQGRTIRTINNPDGQEISIEAKDWNQGIYLFEIIIDKQIYYYKLIKN